MSSIYPAIQHLAEAIETIATAVDKLGGDVDLWAIKSHISDAVEAASDLDE